MKMKMTKALAEQWVETIHCTLISAEIASFQRDGFGNILINSPFGNHLVEQVAGMTEEDTRKLFIKILEIFEKRYGMEWEIEKE